MAEDQSRDLDIEELLRELKQNKTREVLECKLNALEAKVNIKTEDEDDFHDTLGPFGSGQDRGAQRRGQYTQNVQGMHGVDLHLISPSPSSGPAEIRSDVIQAEFKVLCFYQILAQSDFKSGKPTVS
jgi:hypothetical protein